MRLLYYFFLIFIKQFYFLQIHNYSHCKCVAEAANIVFLGKHLEATFVLLDARTLDQLKNKSQNKIFE